MFELLSWIHFIYDWARFGQFIIYLFWFFHSALHIIFSTLAMAWYCSTFCCWFSNWNLHAGIYMTHTLFNCVKWINSIKKWMIFFFKIPIATNNICIYERGGIRIETVKKQSIMKTRTNHQYWQHRSY